jgi:hypothetical protein
VAGAEGVYCDSRSLRSRACAVDLDRTVLAEVLESVAAELEAAAVTDRQALDAYWSALSAARAAWLAAQTGPWLSQARAWVRAQVSDPARRAAWVAQGRPWNWVQQATQVDWQIEEVPEGGYAATPYPVDEARS